MAGFVVSGAGGRKPRNYYRSGITSDDVRLAMEGEGKLTLTQLAARMSDMVTPEAKRRFAELAFTQHATPSRPLDEIMFFGLRNMVKLRLQTMISKSKTVTKHGTGKGCTYEWTGKNDKPKQDQA